MAAEEGNIILGIFTGEEAPEGEVEDEYGEEWPIILPNVTHLSICPSITVLWRLEFSHHPNINKIEEGAFYRCPRLKRLIMPGVKEVEESAFLKCDTIEHVECDKLEIIRDEAFSECTSLKSIDLPSARIVEVGAFGNCYLLRNVKIGKYLDILRAAAFRNCPSLERITIPLKGGLIGHDNIFTGCDNLKRVDLVEEDAVLHETVATLLMEEWRQDMSNVINSINQILPNAPAGDHAFHRGKAQAIREWIPLVVRKIIHTKHITAAC